jgi:hypothetical protein
MTENETLGDLIDMAGGFTPHAKPPGSGSFRQFRYSLLFRGYSTRISRHPL